MSTPAPGGKQKNEVPPVPKDYEVREVWSPVDRLFRGRLGELIGVVICTAIVTFMVLGGLVLLALYLGVLQKGAIGDFTILGGGIVSLTVGLATAVKWYFSSAPEPLRIRISFQDGTVTFDNFWIDTRSFFPAPYTPRAVVPFKALKDVYRYHGRGGGYISLFCPTGKIVIPGAIFSREELDQLTDILLLITTGKKSPQG